MIWGARRRRMFLLGASVARGYNESSPRLTWTGPEPLALRRHPVKHVRVVRGSVHRVFGFAITQYGIICEQKRARTGFDSRNWR
ncbi:uncharacterized protein SCHCODRAFT_01260586 [Schizophyllum commune H4-8]|uniref:uncharacterized protein n=1 Tax=Schizophyllum commune (strain H4-8 / FGSC 9210) TaxID=578458 RepID=UPI00215F0177|nr:uncharacterized protein SCHCODRAFT_01260586 [Schizophyllum commune H4-8]KAI5885455.1 hypothetical protein SCHCODRAFT_01260586 [Schizophyllum commune H4-8]